MIINIEERHNKLTLEDLDWIINSANMRLCRVEDYVCRCLADICYILFSGRPIDTYRLSYLTERLESARPTHAMNISVDRCIADILFANILKFTHTQLLYQILSNVSNFYYLLRRIEIRRMEQCQNEWTVRAFRLHQAMIDLDVRDLYPSNLTVTTLTTYSPSDICNLLDRGRVELTLQQIVETVTRSKAGLVTTSDSEHATLIELVQIIEPATYEGKWRYIAESLMLRIGMCLTNGKPDPQRIYQAYSNIVSFYHMLKQHSTKRLQELMTSSVAKRRKVKLKSEFVTNGYQILKLEDREEEYLDSYDPAFMYTLLTSCKNVDFHTHLVCIISRFAALPLPKPGPLPHPYWDH